MGVTFTPNIGLAKPDQAELASNWAKATKLAEDNNIIIAAKMAITPVTYTPVWRTNAGLLSVGAGSIVGEYVDFQGIIIGNIAVAIGAGFTTNTGPFNFSLPAVVDSTYHRVNLTLTGDSGSSSIIGEGYITDNSSVAASGTIAVGCNTSGGVSYATGILETYAGKAQDMFQNNHPFGLAIGDQWSLNFMYKRV